jgi:WD40 repeat protein
MKQKILTFDGRTMGERLVNAPGRLRWACWSRMGGTALLVGDGGTVIEYTGDEFARLDSTTTENLRGAEFSPSGESAFACGNSGLVLSLTGGVWKRVKEDIRENLRRVAWDPSGKRTLFVGNNGAAYVYAGSSFEIVHGADTHLRSIAWHPRDGYALVAGNCFRDSVGGLSPSPNLFRLEDGSLQDVSTLAESRADLTAASWRPDGSYCLLTGFDQTWHTPALFRYGEEGLREIAWGSENIFPTACAWHPSGEYALIGTSAMTDDEGETAVYKFDGKSVTKLAKLGGLGVSCIAWSRDGLAFVVASRWIRAFSA